VKPVVLVTRKLPAAVEDRLSRDYQARLNPDDRLYSKDALIESARGAQAILPCHTEHFSADVFERLPAEVKIIANFSVGFDHVDIEAAKGKGVVVTNTPDVLSDATAELTMMLMIGAAPRGEGERLMREAKWKDWSPAFMVGTQVTGKRLGIIGMGRVGQVVARRARGFDMKIHYHDVRRLPTEKEEGAVFHETLEDLLPHCDFLTLQCNVTPTTRRLMDARRFSLLPDGAILVNAARGAIVDDDALIDALTSGRLRAAGIDAYNNEPQVDARLIALPTFLMHIGSATAETDAMGFRALDNQHAYFAGRLRPRRVTEPRVVTARRLSTQRRRGR
jgi:lactate dehydrogenase-like 2-hydroxyacid dehydrogenase